MAATLKRSPLPESRVSAPDVSEFRGELRDFRRATTASFNTLRQDFVDLRTHVDNGFTEVRGKFDVMTAGQQQIVDLVQTIITDQGRNETNETTE